MNKTLLFSVFIAVILLTINILTAINFYRFKKESAINTIFLLNQNEVEKKELYSYRTNFIEGFKNNNLWLENIQIKDSLNESIFLHDYLKAKNQNSVLVCRFSETNCESCVDYSIQILRHCIDSSGIKNILFLGTYRNNKIFNRQKSMYGIQQFNVYNTPELNIPVEKMGYPYYFVIDINLQISNVFIPDKATPQITIKYMEYICNKFKQLSHAKKI